jgi:hypothetical protein
MMGVVVDDYYLMFALYVVRERVRCEQCERGVRGRVTLVSDKRSERYRHLLD